VLDEHLGHVVETPRVAIRSLVRVGFHRTALGLGGMVEVESSLRNGPVLYQSPALHKFSLPGDCMHAMKRRVYRKHLQGSIRNVDPVFP
jgi:hypothetical protein